MNKKLFYTRPFLLIFTQIVHSLRIYHSKSSNNLALMGIIHSHSNKTTTQLTPKILKTVERYNKIKIILNNNKLPGVYSKKKLLKDPPILPLARCKLKTQKRKDWSLARKFLDVNI